MNLKTCFPKHKSDDGTFNLSRNLNGSRYNIQIKNGKQSNWCR